MTKWSWGTNDSRLSAAGLYLITDTVELATLLVIPPLNRRSTVVLGVTA